VVIGQERIARSFDVGLIKSRCTRTNGPIHREVELGVGIPLQTVSVDDLSWIAPFYIIGLKYYRDWLFGNNIGVADEFFKAVKKR
jgi:hypothetical protein